MRRAMLWCGCQTIEFRSAGWKANPSFRAYTESARSFRPEGFRIAFPINGRGSQWVPIIRGLLSPDCSIKCVKQHVPGLPALFATSKVVKKGRDIESLASLNAQSLKILAADQLEHGPPPYSTDTGRKYHKRENSRDNFPTKKMVPVPRPNARARVWAQVLCCRTTGNRS